MPSALLSLGFYLNTTMSALHVLSLAVDKPGIAARLNAYAVLRFTINLAWSAGPMAAAFLAHMVMCGLLFAFGMLCHFRIAYLLGWAIIVGCLVMEHWIARRRSLNWINVAFFRLNALVGAVFLVVVAAEVIFQGGFKLR